MEPPPQLSSNRMTRGHGVGDGPEAPSNNLWVGNLSADTNDGDLMDLFIKYGALDSVRTYSSRNFAFVYFKRVEDAKAAKDALQGTSFRGNALKIEFARPVCPNICDFDFVFGVLDLDLYYLCNNLIGIVGLFDENVILPSKKMDYRMIECEKLIQLTGLGFDKFDLLF